MYHDTTASHLAVGHSLSRVLPSETCFQTISEIKAVQKAHSNSRWRHTFSRSISTQSALDMFMSMRYTNLRFIIIIIITLYNVEPSFSFLSTFWSLSVHCSLACVQCSSVILCLDDPEEIIWNTGGTVRLPYWPSSAWARSNFMITFYYISGLSF